MPFVFRAIKKDRWLPESNLSWLASDDVPADPLTDLKTQENTLSVYMVNDDLANLERVQTAFAATRQKPNEKLGYVLINIEFLKAIAIKFEDTVGVTPDKTVNMWHKDIIELSGFGLTRLVKLCLAKGFIHEVLPKKVNKLLLEGIDAGWLDISKLNKELRNKLNLP